MAWFPLTRCVDSASGNLLRMPRYAVALTSCGTHAHMFGPRRPNTNAGVKTCGSKRGDPAAGYQI